jgi:hypothetical protein
MVIPSQLLGCVGVRLAGFGLAAALFDFFLRQAWSQLCGARRAARVGRRSETA